MNYVLHLVIYFEIYLIVGLSLNLVVGYCGLLTLAHAGFYAIGAYTYAVLTVSMGWGFVPAVLTGAAVAAVISLLASLPAWRLKGDFFFLATMAVQALIYSGLYNWTSADQPLGSWGNLTNGPYGIVGIPRAQQLGMVASSPVKMAAFTTAVAALCAWLIWRITASPWGRVLKCIRDDELAARGLGKDSRLAKVQVVALSAAFAAIAGGLYASHIGYVDPSVASLDESILMLSMVIVGGLGTFRGPVMGSACLILLPEVLRFLDLPDARAASLRLLIYGLILIVLMRFRPEGLGGQYRIQ